MSLFGDFLSKIAACHVVLATSSKEFLVALEVEGAFRLPSEIDLRILISSGRLRKPP